MASTSTPPEEQTSPPLPARRAARARAAKDVARRLEELRAAEGPGLAPSLLRLLQDVILLLRDLARSPGVPRREKVVAALAVAYLLSPIDVIPDWLPIAGQADDVAVAVTALRRLMRAAGYDVIYDLWRGSDEGLALVLTLAGVDK